VVSQEWGPGAVLQWDPAAKPSVGVAPPEADEYHNMKWKWKKNQFGGRKVVRQATMLAA